MLHKFFKVSLIVACLLISAKAVRASNFNEIKNNLCSKKPSNCVQLGEESLAFIDDSGKFSLVDKGGSWSPEGLYKVTKIRAYKNMVLIFTPWIIDRPGSVRILDNSGNPINEARPGDVYLVNKDHKWANICHGNIGDVEVVSNNIFVTYEGGYVLWYQGATDKKLGEEPRYGESLSLGPYFIDTDGREIHIEMIFSYPPVIKKDPSLKVEYQVDDSNSIFWPVGGAELNLKFGKDEKEKPVLIYYFNKMMNYE